MSSFFSGAIIMTCGIAQFFSPQHLGGGGGGAFLYSSNVSTFYHHFTTSVLWHDDFHRVTFWLFS